MKNQLPDKLLRAINKTILNSPFFATLLLQRNIIIDDTCKTAWTDGKRIGFSSKFIEGNDLDILEFTLAHEVLHIANLHHTRMNDKEAKLWNKACDLAINPILQECGFKLWPKCLIDPRFKDMSAENIFRTLEQEEQEKQKQQKQDQQNNQNGNGQPDPNSQPGDDKDDSFGEVRPCNKGDETKEEEETKVQTKQAERIAKQQGKEPAFIKRMYANIPPNNDWREDLAKFCSVVSNTDYSFNKVNTRYSSTGFIFPGLHSKEIGNIILACDTSGSITEQEIAIMVTEMLNILETLSEKGQDIEIPTIYCDSSVKHVEYLGFDSQPHPVGGGGTDFRPPFQYANEYLEQPAGFVYITDGECSSFPENPGYPVLWALFKHNPSFNPPFGEVTYIANGGK